MKRLLVLLLATLLTTGCSVDAPPLELGVKRVALSLAFAEEELAEPVAPRVLYELVPAPPELIAAPDVPYVAPSFELPSFLACQPAPEGAPLGAAVERVAAAPPVAGTYLRRNTGTIHIEGGVVPIDLPYPPLSTWVHGEPTEVSVTPTPVAGNSFQVPTEPAPADEYEVVKTLTPDFTITDRLRRTPTAIELVSRVTNANGTESTFTPEPPIIVHQFDVEGTQWTSAGMDTATGTAMLFEGTIEAREIVDVCGTIVDTYRVTFVEQVVNLRTGEVSGSQPNVPNAYNIAPQLGGLIVREDVHSTLTAREPNSGATVLVQMDYVSTLASPDPIPKEYL